MPDDFLSGILDIGAEGRGWRSGWAIFGLLAGVAVGGYLGYAGGGIGAAFAGAGTGALIGWLGGVFLVGAFRLFALFLICLALVLGWYWLTGRV